MRRGLAGFVPLVAVVALILLSGTGGGQSAWASDDETGATAAATATPAAAGASSESAESKGPYVMPPIGEVIKENPHNKLVHFPVALGLTAFLFFLLGVRRPALTEAARLMVLLAALCTVPVYFTGIGQSEEFMKDPKQWLMMTHRGWGITTAIGFWIWAGICYNKPTQKYAWLWGIVMAGLITVTAMLGGLVAA